MDGFRSYVIEQLSKEDDANARAVAALMAIPVKVQSMMTEAELEAVIRSVAKAIKTARN